MMLPHLDERLRRMYLASEAENLGRGGAKEISESFGIHPNTLTAGKKDLHARDVLTTDDGKFYRTRRKGGGRKNIGACVPWVDEITVNSASQLMLPRSAFVFLLLWLCVWH